MRNRPLCLNSEATVPSPDHPVVRMKVYRRGPDVLVAACDSKLLGKTFKEGILRLHVSPAFYDGTEVSPEELVANLQMATIGNFVGEETIRIAQEAGFVDGTAVLRIQGVPHAQMVMV